MAEASNTLAGLVQMNDMNLADIDVSDLLDASPLLQVLNAVPASNGTLHKYLKQTVAPAWLSAPSPAASERRIPRSVGDRDT